jgi:5-methylcytosine-specific restriction enzyme A
MPLLYYWRSDNYFRDLDFGLGYHLNHSNPILHNIEVGDSLWAFTRLKNKMYVLACEMIIKSKTFNPPEFRYGKYRVWGDLEKSRYFDVQENISLEQVIRNFDINTKAKVLGQSFQGFASVKQINFFENQILTKLSQNLRRERRAKILPEEQLEAEIMLGNAELVQELVKSEDYGISKQRREYLYKIAPKRNLSLVKELNRIYKGQCQICGWQSVKIYGVKLCEAHHIQWLSRGGEDELKNMILICPNHHTAIHKLDAPLDYKNYSFDFGNFKEKIIINNHL